MSDFPQHIDSLVDDYLHDLLDAGAVERVERHCAECAACRDALEAAQSRLAALRAVPASEPSDDLIRKTLQRIEREGTTMAASKPSRRVYSPWHRRMWSTFLAAAAIAAAVIGVVQWRYATHEPSPYDLRILGQNDLLAATPASLRVSVYDRSRQEFAPNVPLHVALLDRSTQKIVHEEEASTAAGGPTSVSFEPPEGVVGDFDLVVRAGTDQGDELLRRQVTIRRAVKLMLSCDKPVYQPGQTIHFRSLTLRRPDLKPVQNEQAVFSVSDPKGNVVFKRTLPTSKFGIAAADCPLTTEILEGTYQLRCVVAGETSERSVEVRKYVLPKFKVNITLDKPFYKPAETIAGTLDAGYFFGKPVAGSEVKLQLVTTDVENKVLEEHTEKTDDDGKLSFQFALPATLVGQPQQGGAATVRVVAQVTDTAGQSQATAATRVVTAEAIHLEVIPEAGRLVPGVSNRIYIFASYPDGKPAQAKINGSVLPHELETSELGVASFVIQASSSAGPGPWLGSLRASDSEGRIGNRTVSIPYGSTASDFLLRPDQPAYNAGDTMQLTALGGGREPVFVDLLKDGQSLVSQTIEMRDGKGDLALDLPADITGVLELWAYRFTSDGLAHRKSRLVLVRPAKELVIKASLDREEHRPGEQAKMNFQVVDADGKPVPGALSVAVVDEAVFSVLSQSTGLPQLFFLLDQELLQPVYAIYDQWSPLVRSELPEPVRQEFDEAMFCLTARSASDIDGTIAAFNQHQAITTKPDVRDRMFGVASPLQVPANATAEPNTPFNLTAATYHNKAVAVEQERERGLRGSQLAWGIWTITLCLAGVLSVALYFPRVFLWSSAVVGVLAGLACGGIGLMWLLLPAHQFDIAMAKAGMAPMAAMAMEGEMPTEATMLFSDAGAQGVNGPEPIRVRKDFPETLLWLPEIVTDDEGRASLDIPLADSITTWRLSAAAVAGTGQLGSGEFPIRVFQPFFVDFNLPVALTRGDEASIPIVVYNYLEQPQTVTLNLSGASWYQRLDADDPNAELKIELGPREVKSLHVRIKVLEVGQQHLEVAARGWEGEAPAEPGNADAVRREIEVLPDGRRIVETYAGHLEGRIDHPLELPSDRIPGSTRLIAKVYPATFAQLVEGLDSVFQMPSGCFEQTSSTTYPSVLALDYLKRNRKASPELEAKARQYIHIGYQRLLSFEVDGGGFDWFGQPPANRTLTAYGLMEFDDMARVHDVDPNLIARTRQWLLAQRKPDGSWEPEPHMLNDGLAGSVGRSGDVAALASTAYIGWAVFRGGNASDQAGATIDFLVKHEPSTIDDPYALAIVTNALAALKPDHAALKAYADRLEALKQRDPATKHTWWEQPAQSETMFHGNGESGKVEATAMAALALMAAKQHPGSVHEALTWITTTKVEGGTWGSTQATVLALQALLQGIDKASDTKERRFELAINGETVEEVVLSADQFDVVQQIDLTSHLPPSPLGGEGRGEGQSVTVSLEDKSDSAPSYQLTLRYHVPGEPDTPPQEPLSIKIAYDREQLEVNDHIAAACTVINQTQQPSAMVILDLPIPGGFVIQPGELEELVGSKIEKFQITPRKAIVYLRNLAPDTPLELNYRLKATMPVKVSVPHGEAYQYYTPENRGREKEERVFVVGDA